MSEDSTNQKPLPYHTTASIGRATDGTLEFGEIYHVVVGRALNAEFRLQFVDFPHGESFYCLFFGDKPLAEAGSKKPSVTTNWIRDNYGPEVQQQLWATIATIAAKAEKEKWKEELPQNLERWLTDKDTKLLIWLRHGKFEKYRNITNKAVEQLRTLCEKLAITPLFIGSEMQGVYSKDESLCGFHLDENDDAVLDFFSEDNIAKQLWFLNLLYEEGGVIASIGMMSGAMDGLAMIAAKEVIFIAREEDAARMDKIVEVVPSLHRVATTYKKSFKELEDPTLSEIRTHLVRIMKEPSASLLSD